MPSCRVHVDVPPIDCDVPSIHRSFRVFFVHLPLREHPNSDGQQNISVTLCVCCLDGQYMIIGSDRFVKLPLVDRLKFQVESGTLYTCAVIAPHRWVGLQSIWAACFGHHGRHRFYRYRGQDSLEDLVARHDTWHQVQAHQLASRSSFARGWVVSIRDQNRCMVPRFAEDSRDDWMDQLTVQHYFLVIISSLGFLLDLVQSPPVTG